MSAAREEPQPGTTAVLLVNLGTPDSPSVGDVRNYLREFLSAPRVLDMSAIGRALLLHGYILRTRPRKVAPAYASVWTEMGSPLLVESQKLRDGVAAELGGAFRVELAMRYGKPSIRSALQRLLEAEPERLVVAPLFPQYTSAATGSALARVSELLSTQPAGNLPEVRTLPAFYDDPGFLEAWRETPVTSLLIGSHDKTQLRRAAERVLGATRVSYQGVEIDFGGAWPRRSLAEAIEEKTGIDIVTIGNCTEEQIAKSVKQSPFPFPILADPEQGQWLPQHVQACD